MSISSNNKVSDDVGVRDAAEAEDGCACDVDEEEEGEDAEKDEGAEVETRGLLVVGVLQDCGNPFLNISLYDSF
tara:strand:- start:2273 stop:2494 length:222 start_codon:yes stop_codon:yes gene_type:complete